MLQAAGGPDSPFGARTRTARTVLAALVVALSGCAPNPGTTPTPSGAAHSNAPAAHLSGPVDHVVVVIEENHGFDQIAGSPQAPYLNSLIQRGALASDYHAVAHPSLPNYLALIGGSTFGITQDCSPKQTGCHTGATSLPDRIEAAGLSWRGYFEGMPGPCTTRSSGAYRVHHDPFVYFDAIRQDNARCRAHVVPLSALASDFASEATTPRFSLIVPTNADNMHSGTITAADSWLRGALTRVLASPAWRAGRTLLIVTWDEDDGSPANRVATIFYGGPVKTGFRSLTPYTHYSLLRTIENWLGLPTLTAQDAGAAPMSDMLRP